MASRWSRLAAPLRQCQCVASTEADVDEINELESEQLWLSTSDCLSPCRVSRQFEILHMASLLGDTMEQVSGKSDSFAPSSELYWVNCLLALLWPHISLAVTTVVKEKLAPKVSVFLTPMGYKGFEMLRCELGKSPPELKGIRVEPVADGHGNGIQVYLDGEFGGELSVQTDVVPIPANSRSTSSDNSVLTETAPTSPTLEVAVMGVPFGIRNLRIRGTMIVKVWPLLEEKPIFGGISVAFVDQPKIDMSFEGAAKILDMPMLAKSVHSAIEHAFASLFVLPNAIAVPLGTEQQGVDVTSLRCAEPLGVLKVTLLKASGFQEHPHLRVTLGADEKWLSPACSPKEVRFQLLKAQEIGCELLLHNKEQHLFIDSGGGMMTKLRVRDTFQALLKENYVLRQSGGNGSHEGNVEMQFEWLKKNMFKRSWLKESDRPNADNCKLDNRQCMVLVKCHEMYLPVALDEEIVSVLVEVAGQKKKSPLADHQKRFGNVKGRIFTPRSTIGLKYRPWESQKVPDARARSLKVELAYSFTFLVPLDKLKTAEVKFAVVSKRGRILGEKTLNLCSCSNAGQFTQLSSHASSSGYDFHEIPTRVGEAIWADLEIRVNSLIPTDETFSSSDESVEFIIPSTKPTRLQKRSLRRLTGCLACASAMNKVVSDVHTKTHNTYGRAQTKARSAVAWMSEADLHDLQQRAWELLRGEDRKSVV